VRQAEKAVGGEASGDEIGFSIELLQGDLQEACRSDQGADGAPCLGWLDVCSLDRFLSSLNGVGELHIVPVEDALEARGIQCAVLEGVAHCGWVPSLEVRSDCVLRPVVMEARCEALTGESAQRHRCISKIEAEV